MKTGHILSQGHLKLINDEFELSPDKDFFTAVSTVVNNLLQVHVYNALGCNLLVSPTQTRGLGPEGHHWDFLVRRSNFPCMDQLGPSVLLFSKAGGVSCGRKGDLDSARVGENGNDPGPLWMLQSKISPAGPLHRITE